MKVKLWEKQREVWEGSSQREQEQSVNAKKYVRRRSATLAFIIGTLVASDAHAAVNLRIDGALRPTVVTPTISMQAPAIAKPKTITRQKTSGGKGGGGGGGASVEIAKPKLKRVVEDVPMWKVILLVIGHSIQSLSTFQKPGTLLIVPRACRNVDQILILIVGATARAESVDGLSPSGAWDRGLGGSFSLGHTKIVWGVLLVGPWFGCCVD